MSEREEYERYDLPPGWRWCALADVVESITDGPFGSNLKTSDYVDDGDARVIRLGNIGIGAFKDEDQSFVSREKFTSLLKHEARPGDIVVAALAEPVGRACLVPENIGPAIVKADCVRVRVDTRISTNIVMRWFNSPEGLKSAALASHGIGRLRINLGEIRALPVPLPPSNEQRRIVAKLDAIFEKTRAARTRLERLPNLFVQLKRSILAAAFRGDLTADWREAHPEVEPASALAARIRGQRDDRTSLPPDTAYSSQLPEAELPSTWFVALTANVGSVQLGRQLSAGKYTGALHPYVRVANVADDRLSFEDIKEMEFSPQELAHYLLRPGDIVLSEGQSLDRLGQSAMYRAGDPAVCYQKTLNRFRATEAGPLPEYAQLYFRFCMHTGVFRAAGSITTNIAHLTQEKLRRIPFVLCPLEEQRVLVERARGALARLEDLQAGVSSVLARFASVEQAALAKAFRGELVDQDPNDEPAAALIERIRALVDTRTERGAAKLHGRVARAKSQGRTALTETES